jgi:hypothetical protein
MTNQTTTDTPEVTPAPLPDPRRLLETTRARRAELDLEACPRPAEAAHS